MGDISLSSYAMLIDECERLECTIENGCEGESSEEKEDSKSEFIHSGSRVHLSGQMSNMFYKSSSPICTAIHQFAREIPVPPPDFA